MPEWKPRAERLANGLESKPGLIVALLALLYFVLIVAPLRKPLWHDELYTFYIAQSPSVSRFVDSVQHIDWQPPMIFATAWLSQHIFGVNEFGTRFPSVLAFFCASIGLFLLLKRHWGALWAVAPILLLWFSFYFKYSTEARPYGLLAAFFVLSLYCYDRAISPVPSRNRNWYIAGLFLGNVGMMLSHVLAPFSVMPFAAAELVRTVQRRKVDFGLWFAILAPLILVAQSLGMVNGFEKSYFPVDYQASPRKMVSFFAKAVFYVWPLLALGALTAFGMARSARQQIAKTESPRLNAPWLAFAATVLLPPFLVNFVMMRSAGAFWERYCITTALAIYVLCALGLASIARWGRVASLAVVFALLAAGLAQTAVLYRSPPPLHRLEAIRPDLALVAAGGVSFLEIDHYENPALLKRTYYLTDRPSAIQFGHTTLFEGFGGLRNYFPIRAGVASYSDFVSRNRHFLMLGTPSQPEQWLFAKLRHDGAEVKKLEDVPGPYLDSSVYEVTFH